MKIKYDPTIPIFLQIAQKLKEDVFNGVYKTGDKLPSISELSTMMDVNQNTVIRVYEALDREHLVESRRGMGYFLAATEQDIERLRVEMATGICEKAVMQFRELHFSDEQIIASINDYLKSTGGKK